MKVEQILKKITSETKRKEIEKIKKVKLPLELRKWIKEYKKVGDRDEFIWKWLYRMFLVIKLPVDCQKYQKSLMEVKILLTIFIVQLDDIADKRQKQKLLTELLKIPLGKNYIKFHCLNYRDREYLVFTHKLWNYIRKQIRKYPNYEELNEIFNYDINQVLNAVKYSYLINRNLYLINKTEYWLYLPHNMTFMVYLMLDLMCCPNFDRKKISALREIIWESQKMGRINNWITTWQRELKNKDFTSGVFAYAIEKNALTVEELEMLSESEIIKKIKEMNIDIYLLKEWESSYNKIKRIGKKNKLARVKNFLKGLKYLLFVDLISLGYK